MKKLLLILLLSPMIVFSQDAKNREMQMQVNNLQPPPPPPGPKGSVVKTNAFLTSSDFVFLQKPTYVGGWLQAVSLGAGRQSMNGVYSYGGNGFVTTDGSQKGISTFVGKGTNNIFFSFTEIGSNRTYTGTYVKLYNGKWNKGFGANLSYTLTATLSAPGFDFTLPPMKIVAPSVMFFTNRTYNTGKFTVTPDLLLSYSHMYWDIGLNTKTIDPTFNALVGTSFGYKLSKRFTLLLAYRGNINTNPKFGLMNNISIGNKFNL
jgi:hypothetical protein